MSNLTLKERNELIDLVAQAVLDRIQERQNFEALARAVLGRVKELQAQETALIGGDSPPHASGQEKIDVS